MSCESLKEQRDEVLKRLIRIPPGPETRTDRTALSRAAVVLTLRMHSETETDQDQKPPTKPKG